MTALIRPWLSTPVPKTEPKSSSKLPYALAGYIPAEAGVYEGVDPSFGEMAACQYLGLETGQG